MLAMAQVHTIRNMFREEGQFVSEIARILKVDRTTVRRWLDKEDWNEQPPKCLQEPTFPKLEPFKETTRQWLEEDRKTWLKQRHTATRIDNRLIDEYADSYTCGYRTVAGFVAQERQLRTNIFVMSVPQIRPAIV